MRDLLMFDAGLKRFAILQRLRYFGRLERVVLDLFSPSHRGE